MALAAVIANVGDGMAKPRSVEAGHGNEQFMGEVGVIFKGMMGLVLMVWP